ncbi:MAG: HAMP domain-containing histidine kinase [Elusimicrobia bacterium]|nr:HAMP domain-containing histidine kinase [Elusimicrobiota bacterium]
MKKIRDKIFLLTLGCLVSSALFLFAFGIRSLKSHLEHEFQLRSLVLIRNFQSIAGENLSRNQIKAAQDFLDSLLANPDVEEAHLLSPVGKVLASKLRGPAAEPFQPDPEMIAKALNSWTALFAAERESGVRYEVIYQRVWSEGLSGVSDLGICYLKLTYYRIDSLVRAAAYVQIAAIAVFTALAVVLAFIFSRRIVRPIEELRAATRVIAQGDFSIQLPVNTADEIGDLTRDFLKMAQELESSRNRLIQSEKMAAVGQMAAGMAHEINNPMGVILGFAQGLAKRLQAGDPMALPVKSIEREALRCKELMQNLLLFSRSSKSQEREDLDLNASVEGALALVRVRAKMANVELVPEFAAGLPKVTANKNQIQQIVVNLCNNAVDAMPEGGQITVRTGHLAGPPAQIELQVQDTGPGIPEEIRAKIFEPFFTTKSLGKGTGLGLSLVYEIVERHNGTIALESGDKKGANFRMRFPVKTV